MDRCSVFVSDEIGATSRFGDSSRPSMTTWILIVAAFVSCPNARKPIPLAVLEQRVFLLRWSGIGKGAIP